MSVATRFAGDLLFRARPRSKGTNPESRTAEDIHKDRKVKVSVLSRKTVAAEKQLSAFSGQLESRAGRLTPAP